MPSAMPWRVLDVQALADYQLRVTFRDGLIGTVDMAKLVHSERAGVFAVMRNSDVFAQAHVIHGAVTWPGEIELAPDAMHCGIVEHGRWVI
jgi:hypothetical protein